MNKEIEKCSCVPEAGIYTRCKNKEHQKIILEEAGIYTRCKNKEHQKIILEIAKEQIESAKQVLDSFHSPSEVYPEKAIDVAKMTLEEVRGFERKLNGIENVISKILAKL